MEETRPGGVEETRPGGVEETRPGGLEETGKERTVVGKELKLVNH